MTLYQSMLPQILEYAKSHPRSVGEGRTYFNDNVPDFDITKKHVFNTSQGQRGIAGRHLVVISGQESDIVQLYADYRTFERLWTEDELRNFFLGFMSQIEAMRKGFRVPALQPTQRTTAPETSTSPSTLQSQVALATETIPLPSPQAQQKSTSDFITTATPDAQASDTGSGVTVVVRSSEQPQVSVTVDQETFIEFPEFAKQKVKKGGKK